MKGHKKACLEYLTEHGTITGKQAWEAFGCYRLASVINRLKKDGYLIETRIVPGERYAEYSLVDVEENDG